MNQPVCLKFEIQEATVSLTRGGLFSYNWLTTTGLVPDLVLPHEGPTARPFIDDISVPNILFVNFNFVLLAKQSKLILKGSHRVMFVLVANVSVNTENVKEA